MENQTQGNPGNDNLITSFCEITSSSKEEAIFFLESHQWDLDSAVSTFLDNATALHPVVPPPSSHAPTAPSPSHSPSPSPSHSPGYSPSPSSPSRSRSRSPSPVASRDPYRLRSRRGADKQPAKPSGSRPTRGVRTIADLNRTPSQDSDSDSDEPQEYYTGGQKSGMLVQDPTNFKDVDRIFDQARQSAVERPAEQLPSKVKSFTGTARLLSGESLSAAPQRPENVMHNITFWRNGFTVDDGPLRRLDDPANASFLQSISNSECPKELEPADRRIQVHVNLMRREEDYIEPPKKRTSFKGTGRTLGSSSTATASAANEPATISTSLNTAPLPSMGLVVNDSLPTTSIQLRLADGTRMVS
ncbi:plant UBX domain-containing protein 5, partial [Carica papaya]|uniref:plant UBX domain-containing protein 5 n=1 Tax=Carica papaya TaxID=3649 RepID=UPI000B8D17E4